MQKKSWVKANNEWVDLNAPEVTFLNIEEDVYGRDSITFLYKKQEFTSLVYFGYNHP